MKEKQHNIDTLIGKIFLIIFVNRQKRGKVIASQLIKRRSVRKYDMEGLLRTCVLRDCKNMCLVAQFLVDSGIVLLYRPTSLCILAGRYDNPMPESSISPRQGLKIWLLNT
jgi:hypothetical protein